MSEAIKPTPKSRMELSTLKRQDSVVVESESEFIVDQSIPKSRGFSVDFSHTLIFKHNPINADNMNALSTPLLKKGSGGLIPSSSNNNMLRISLANQNYDLSAIEKGEGELTDSLDLSGSLIDSEEAKEMNEEQYIKTLTGKFIKNKRELSKVMTHIKWQKYLNQQKQKIEATTVLAKSLD